jgi:outer membrane receptor protein involved in Fe transport
MTRAGAAFGAAGIALALSLLHAAPAHADEADDALHARSASSDIVVTGSRIARSELIGIEPVAAISARQIDDFAWSHFADALDEFPGFQGSVTPRGPQGEFGQGVNFVSAFGLRSNRTLVLVDGQRFVSSNGPSAFSGATAGTQVDLNAVPSILVERVERLAIGGAPAYGSDAIAATVNIRLRRRLSGLEVRALSGVAGEGDNFRWRLGAAGGGQFANGRAHVTFAASYDRVAGVAASERSAFRANVASAANPCTTARADLCSAVGTLASLGPVGRSPASDGRVNPSIGFNDAADDGNPASVLIKDHALAATATGGVISSGPGAYAWRFATDGSLVPYARGTLFNAPLSGPLAAASIGSGGDGFSLLDRTSLVSRSERLNMAALVSFELTERIEAFADAIWYRGKFDEVADLPTFNAVQFRGDSAALTFRTDNPFLSEQARAQLAALGYGQTFQISRANIDLADRSGSAKSDLLRIVSGLKGSASVAGRDYSFDLMVNYGRSNFTDRSEAIDRQKFVNAVNVALIGGAPACSAVPTVSGFAAGVAPVADPACVPLNLFGNGAPSEAALAYVITETRARSRLEQFVVSANLAGAPFSLRGNPVSLSIGAEHREERARFTPDAFLEAGLGRSVAIPRVAGSYAVEAVYGEIAVPIFLPENDAAISKLLAFARVRHVGSNRSGGFTAWSAGGVFAPIRDIEFRGNYTRSFRSPAILEMFLPRAAASLAVPDLCSAANIGLGPAPEVRRANCLAFLARYPGATPLVAATASVPALSGGNPGLGNERASSFTFGASIKPSFVAGLVIEIDWLDIAIRDPIASLTVAEIASACFDNPRFDAADPANGNRFCALIGRDASGQVVSDSRAPAVTTGYVNGERIHFSALQASLSWQTDLDSLGLDGELELGADLFHLRRRTNNITGVSPARSDGLVGDPRWQVQFRLRYANSRWGMASQVNFTGKQLITRVDSFAAPADRGEFHHYRPFATLDLSLFMTVAERTKFSLTTTNLFNRVGQEYHGIVIPGSINDALGRRFAASFTLSL